MGANIRPLNNDEILLILGNGDLKRGYNLLQQFTYGLAVARQKHQWGRDMEINDWHKASWALKDEHDEWQTAMQKETPERQLAEALDVMIVAARIANQEWK